MDLSEEELFEISESESEEQEQFMFVIKKQDDFCFSVPGGGKLVLTVPDKNKLLEWWKGGKHVSTLSMSSPIDKTKWTLSAAENNTVTVTYIGNSDEVKYVISGLEAELMFESYLDIHD